MAVILKVLSFAISFAFIAALGSSIIVPTIKSIFIFCCFWTSLATLITKSFIIFISASVETRGIIISGKADLIFFFLSSTSASKIAKHAEFFSFGTNDLTQTTFGISRDDSGKFLNDYLDNKIFSIDPFVSIDDGVADLVEIAVEKGKSQNKKLKLGICGEHGGDPKSIEFCSKAGLNYVSCSPYRVPIARLAAAQAEIKK